MSVASRRRLRPQLRRPRVRLPRPGPRALLALLVLAGILTGGWFWVRDSSLVAVQRVTVTGVSGPDVGAIRSTLVQAAEQMTTLNVDSARLRAAVARYPFVRRVRTTSHLPHSLTIAVSEQVPVAILDADGTRTAVSSQGRVLRGISAGASSLPTIASAGAPIGGAVTGVVADEVALVAAAPYPLLAHVASASERRGHGLTVALRAGPVVYFGDDSRLAAKWRDVVGVLASSSSRGASYIDVTDPARPAAGSGSDSSSGASLSAGASSATTTSAVTPSATAGATGTTGTGATGTTGTGATGTTGTGATGTTGTGATGTTGTGPSGGAGTGATANTGTGGTGSVTTGG